MNGILSALAADEVLLTRFYTDVGLPEGHDESLPKRPMLDLFIQDTETDLPQIHTYFTNQRHGSPEISFDDFRHQILDVYDDMKIFQYTYNDRKHTCIARICDLALVHLHKVFLSILKENQIDAGISASSELKYLSLSKRRIIFLESYFDLLSRLKYSHDTVTNIGNNEGKVTHEILEVILADCWGYQKLRDNFVDLLKIFQDLPKTPALTAQKIKTYIAEFEHSSQNLNACISLIGKNFFVFV